ncbi:MAG: hypothetical protein HY400_05690, partial [Elusimicrobia bacterium]|nr:hypothetical protein [Elusimicrobiota bacterium]
AYDTCYLCHFKGKGAGRELRPIGGCLGCHDIPQKSFQIANMTYNHKDFVVKQGLACQNCHLDVVRGEGKAPEDRCFTCHNQPEKLKRYGDIPFLHENHVTKHHVACFRCHQEIRHGFESQDDSRIVRLGEPLLALSTVGVSGRSPTLTFDCSYCHQNKHTGQLEMYSGKVSALGLPEMPSPMYLAQVDCVGCHYSEKKDVQEEEFRGKTYRASTQACVKCHGSKFEGIWQETKSELEEGLAQLERKLDQIRSAIAASHLAGQERREIEKKAARAEHWHHFVHASRGEHNIYLASLALRREDEILSEIGERIQAQTQDLSSLPLLSGGFCATLCHSKIGVQVPPETVETSSPELGPMSGKTMPHRAHMEMMGCVKCHEIGAHKKVPLRKQVQSVCAGCHP